MKHGSAYVETGLVAVPSVKEQYCYPCSVVVLPDGRLMTTFTWNVDREGIGRNLGASCYSSDGGSSWTAPEALFSDDCPFEYIPEERQNYADPNVVVFHDKVVVYCISLRFEPGRWNLSASRLWYRVSTNSGREWSVIKEMKLHKKFVSGTNHPGIRLMDGSVIMGYSWEMKAERMEQPEGEGEQVYCAGVLRTTDGGHSWVPGGDVFISASKGDGVPHAISGADDHPEKRVRLSVRLSDDLCRTWTDPKILAPATFHQWQPEASYPAVCQLPDGVIVAVWGEIRRDDPSDRFKIHYARFNREWVLS